ncbi:solute carrier family 35 member f6 [Anaeramoeba flamelloides]|uniref:Solute carrier family 35 member f6 n=1 Tax=Anaeramoeba flamelloides TaxID=1746091 RepID=A0ABQ8XJ34_9EUKA|nr:solute carrier family 35 member f6 [Anaeramoeba flamelloides]
MTQTWVLILGMLTTGSVNTVSKKAMFNTEAVGTYSPKHHFDKPFTQTLIMFLGELLVILMYLRDLRIKKKQQKLTYQDTFKINKDNEDVTDVEERKKLLGDKNKKTNSSFEDGSNQSSHDPDFHSNSGSGSGSGSGSDNINTINNTKSELKSLTKDPKSKQMKKTSIWLFLLPAICDVFGTSLAGLGLMYTTASVFQMLRGSIIVFSAIIAVTVMRRKLHVYQWTGIFIVTAGLVLVGLSSIKGEKSTRSVNKTLLGILFILLGQFVSASQFSIEEHFLKNKPDVTPQRVVGTEGMFGTIIMTAIVLPILYYIPGKDNGSQENAIDSAVMISNNWFLALMVVLYWLSIAFYNFFSLTFAKQLSTVHRTLIDTCRTLCVWLVEILIGISKPKYGETWSKWSFLQLGGFFLLVLGTAIHHGVLKLDFLQKHLKKKSKANSSSN